MSTFFRTVIEFRGRTLLYVTIIFFDCVATLGIETVRAIYRLLLLVSVCV